MTLPEDTYAQAPRRIAMALDIVQREFMEPLPEKKENWRGDGPCKDCGTYNNPV